MTTRTGVYEVPNPPETISTHERRRRNCYTGAGEEAASRQLNHESPIALAGGPVTPRKTPES
jgi:hypothetical protein